VTSRGTGLSPANSARAWAGRFDALERLCRRDSQARGTYSVGGHNLDVFASSDEAATWFGLPVQHLAGAFEEGRRLEVRLGHGGAKELDPLWNAAPDEDSRSRPRLVLGDGRDVVGGLWPHAGMFGLLHRRRAISVLWIRDLDRASPVEAATLFRALVAWWLADSEYVVAHAAAIAGSRGAALLLGRGGSGKSSTAAACFEAGLSFLGDDSVLCRASTTEVFSLCAGANLPEEELARHHPSLNGGAPRPRRDGKRYLDLASADPDRVATRAPLRALVRLTIGDGTPGGLEPVARSRALTALAPSSILNIPALDRDALSSMTALARRLPAYELTLSGDRSEAARLLGRLLDETGSG